MSRLDRFIDMVDDVCLVGIVLTIMLPFVVVECVRVAGRHYLGSRP